MPRGRNAGKGTLVQRGSGQSFKTLREVRAGVKKGYRGPREERGGQGGWGRVRDHSTSEKASNGRKLDPGEISATGKRRVLN